MATILSDYDRAYHRSELNAILEKLASEESEIPTSSFEFLSPRIWSFVGKDNRPFLRRCLRTLESEGLIENINKGFNHHYWKITESEREKITKVFACK